MLAMAAMVMSCVLASGAGSVLTAGSSIRDPIETSTAHTGGDDPILLFTDPADAAVEPWGLMQAHYNRATEQGEPGKEKRSEAAHSRVVPSPRPLAPPVTTKVLPSIFIFVVGVSSKRETRSGPDAGDLD